MKRRPKRTGASSRGSSKIDELVAESIRRKERREELRELLNRFVAKNLEEGDEDTMIYALEGAAQRVRSIKENVEYLKRKEFGVDPRIC